MELVSQGEDLEVQPGPSRFGPCVKLNIVQVKYEMLRRVRIDEQQVAETAAAFGFSRPSFYAARAAFQQAGLPGLLPRKRGPRQAHKLTDEVLAVLTTVRADDGSVPRTTALAAIVKDRFGITAASSEVFCATSNARKKNVANSLGGTRLADPRDAI
jgi:hypothetical protein